MQSSVPSKSHYYRFFRVGIKGRLIWLFLLFALLPFTFSSYYNYQTTLRSLIEEIHTSDKEDVEENASNFQDYMELSNKSLVFLRNFYALQGFLQWRSLNEPYKTALLLEEVADAFQSYVANIEEIVQLQILDLKGQELLHIDYDVSQATAAIAPTAKLKTQKDADYFIKTLPLQEGEVHVTPIYQSLNGSKGVQLSLIDYATPIVDQNKVKQAILIISVNATILLDELQKDKYQEHHYLLIEQSGYYLYHPEKTAQWSIAYNTSLAHDIPELFSAITTHPSETLTHKKVIASFTRIYPVMNSGNYWVLIKMTSETNVFSKVAEFKLIFVATFIVIIVAVIVIAGWFAQRIVTPLLQVNHQLKLLALGELVTEEVAYRGTDEIAEIITASRQLKNAIQNTIEQTQAIAAGDYATEIKLRSERDQLGIALTEMTKALLEANVKAVCQNWLKTGQAQLNEKMSGEQNIETLSKNVITLLTKYLEAQVGLFYLWHNAHPPKSLPYLRLIAGYAYTTAENKPLEFAIGEGLIGEAALEKRIITRTQSPEERTYVTQSGLTKAVPHYVVLLPVLYEGNVKAVVELGFVDSPTAIQREFLEQATANIGIAVNTAESRTQLQELLRQSQTQTEELQSQTEELQTQQEELRQINEELARRTDDLERQKEQIREKNQSLEKAQRAIEIKAQELELASKYKSEFLANMSHELRTPLNSMLILAQLLTENRQGNLDNKQIEYAQTIHSAGSDLLTLINEILDLSKVEAGKVEVHVEEIELSELVDALQQKFKHLAEEKGLGFTVEIAKELPTSIRSDGQRLKQVMNNLLSNAFKFTATGEIKLILQRPQNIDDLLMLKLTPEKTIAISVTDTGIGIPKDKQQVIFEAFQQADGTTSRRYGGTGLGLSISRQLSRLLGGEIKLASEEGKGSTFTFYLPEDIGKPLALLAEPKLAAPTTESPLPSQSPAAKTPKEQPFSSPPVNKQNGQPLEDDREHINAEDKTILFIEDDRKFVRVLIDLAHEKGFKCIVAEDGKMGLQLVEQYQPNAVILDVGLPKVDGLTVMERLKDNPETRHIPVHFISASDQSMDAKRMGAIGYLLKPVNIAEIGDAFKKISQFITKTPKNLLVIGEEAEKVLDLVGGDEVQIITVATAAAAWKQLQEIEFDCIILDINIEKQSGIKFLEQLQPDDELSQIPIIIYASRELTPQEEIVLQQCTHNLTIKAVESPERLLDETTLFLHQVEATLPQKQQKILRMIHDKEAILSGKRVLIVDDDTRNVFALTTVLEDRGIEVISKVNGKKALEFLAQNPNIDMILMDVMMPEMDGYETMQHLRADERFRKLPIIALTAKAMKGDKAKCIEAGANDYLAKPVDTHKLLSLMRVWLYR